VRYLLLYLVFTNLVQAAELTQEQAFNAYAIAFGNAGYIPPRAPTINLTDRQFICGFAKMKADCPIRALTYPNGVIAVDKTLDFSDPFDASILIHEMVHYIDWSKDGPATNCSEWLRREQRAYTIQCQALEKIGVDASQVYLSLRMLQCQDPKQ
jgi:hypothetical protein